MSAKFDDELYGEILEYAKERGIPKTVALRDLAREGLKAWKLKRALSLYREGKVTLWKASRLAGIPLSKMVEIVASKRIPIHYGMKDLKSDFEAVFGEEIEGHP